MLAGVVKIQRAGSRLIVGMPIARALVLQQVGKFDDKHASQLEAPSSGALCRTMMDLSLVEFEDNDGFYALVAWVCLV
jgi:hypothetical protein